MYEIWELYWEDDSKQGDEKVEFCGSQLLKYSQVDHGHFLGILVNHAEKGRLHWMCSPCCNCRQMLEPFLGLTGSQYSLFCGHLKLNGHSDFFQDNIPMLRALQDKFKGNCNKDKEGKRNDW